MIFQTPVEGTAPSTLPRGLRLETGRRIDELGGPDRHKLKLGGRLDLDLVKTTAHELDIELRVVVNDVRIDGQSGVGVGPKKGWRFFNVQIKRKRLIEELKGDACAGAVLSFGGNSRGSMRRSPWAAVTLTQRLADWVMPIAPDCSLAWTRGNPANE